MSATRVAEPAAALTAIAFLTRVPLGRFARHDGASVAAGTAYFSIAGAAIGLAVGSVAAMAGRFTPPLLAAALAVAFLTVLTGGLHLDALADSADALGGRDRDERLRIMRDPATGPFGAAALCLVLSVETAAVAALVEQDSGLIVFAAVGAASRAVAPPLAAALPYARTAESATAVTSGFTVRRAVAAVAAAGAVGAAAGVAGLLVLAAALGSAAAAGAFCRSWIGGVTGDTLGATIQLAEAAALVAAVGAT